MMAQRYFIILKPGCFYLSRMISLCYTTVFAEKSIIFLIGKLHMPIVGLEPTTSDYYGRRKCHLS
jgi:hypothetical protein